MSTWSSTVTGGTWYYNSDNTDIGLPIITPDASPSLSSYTSPPDLTNVKMLWQFPTTAVVNLHLPYPGVYSSEPDLIDVKLSWQVFPEKNYGLPYICDIPTYGAFTRCSNLASVVIPTSVKKIGPYTFQGTALSEATIPCDCIVYGTSFPPSCTVTWSLKGMRWANYEANTTTGMSGERDDTKLMSFDYTKIPKGMNVVGFKPTITLTELMQSNTLEYLVCWYSDSDYLGYDDFALATGSSAVYRPVRAGATRLRIWLKYSNDANISASDFTTTQEISWLSTLISTTDITSLVWENKSCSTSDGVTLTNSSTTLFCQNYSDIGEGEPVLFMTSDDDVFELSGGDYYSIDTLLYHLFSVDAKTINGEKLDYEVFIWTDATFDGVYDYSGSGICHNLAGNKMRIQLKKCDGSNISPDELAYVRIKWY